MEDYDQVCQVVQDFFLLPLQPGCKKLLFFDVAVTNFTLLDALASLNWRTEIQMLNKRLLMN